MCRKRDVNIRILGFDVWNERSLGIVDGYRKKSLWVLFGIYFLVNDFGIMFNGFMGFIRKKFIIRLIKYELKGGKIEVDIFF